MPKIEGDLELAVYDLGVDIMSRINGISGLLGTYVSETLEEEVNKTVYEAYTPESYVRTESLVNSIQSYGNESNSDDGNGVTFGARFDKDLLDHTSLLTPSREPEQTYNVPLWANEGWSWVKGMSREDILHPTKPPREAPNYIENTFWKIAHNEEIIRQIQTVVNDNYHGMGNIDLDMKIFTEE